MSIKIGLETQDKSFIFDSNKQDIDLTILKHAIQYYKSIVRYVNSPTELAVNNLGMVKNPTNYEIYKTTAQTSWLGKTTKYDLIGRYVVYKTTPVERATVLTSNYCDEILTFDKMKLLTREQRDAKLQQKNVS